MQHGRLLGAAGATKAGTETVTPAQPTLSLTLLRAAAQKEAIGQRWRSPAAVGYLSRGVTAEQNSRLTRVVIGLPFAQKWTQPLQVCGLEPGNPVIRRWRIIAQGRAVAKSLPHCRRVAAIYLSKWGLFPLSCPGEQKVQTAPWKREQHHLMALGSACIGIDVPGLEAIQMAAPAILLHPRRLRPCR